MDISWIELMAPLLTGGLGSGIGLYFGKRQRNAQAEKTEAEADSIEIQNVANALKIWRETAQEQSNEIKALKEENMNLNRSLMNLQKENIDLKATVKKLDMTVRELEECVETLKGQLNGR